MKALIVASVASMIEQFNMNNIIILKELGYEVHVCCNFKQAGNITPERSNALKEKLELDGVKCFQIDFSRNVFNLFGHIAALNQLKHVISNQYQLVHCHSPIGGMLTRIACKKYRKQGINVIYTAHGFHFYKGAPLKNWIVFYPIEKICSKMTDTLITINKEDFECAQTKMKAKNVKYVPGVGIDINKYKNVVISKEKKREEIGVPKDAFLLLSIGELNKNKNHRIVIKALSRISSQNVHYVIAGQGVYKKHLLKLASKYKLEDRIHLLGYRSDVPELFKCADCFIHPSFREGLPVSVMEAMASGLRCLVSDIRGCRDLITDKYSVFNPKRIDEVIECINFAIKLWSTGYVKYDLSMFSLSNVNNEIRNIYKNHLD